MPLIVKEKKNSNKLDNFFERMLKVADLSMLDKFGKKGVEALVEFTPKDTGLTAQSWSYEIERTKDTVTLSWLNSNIQNGTNIAIVIYTGHVTRTGYHIKGRDYITPALESIFDGIAKEIDEEVNG